MQTHQETVLSLPGGLWPPQLPPAPRALLLLPSPSRRLQLYPHPDSQKNPELSQSLESPSLWPWLEHTSHTGSASQQQGRRGGGEEGSNKGWARKATQSRGQDKHRGSVARLQHLTILHQACSATWLQCQHTKRPTSCGIETDHKPHVLSDLSGHITKTLKLPEPCDKEQNLTLIILSGTAVCLHAVFEKKVWLMQCLARQTLDLSWRAWVQYKRRAECVVVVFPFSNISSYTLHSAVCWLSSQVLLFCWGGETETLSSIFAATER